MFINSTQSNFWLKKTCLLGKEIKVWGKQNWNCDLSQNLESKKKVKKINKIKFK